jgi:hypothetical protein
MMVFQTQEVPDMLICSVVGIMTTYLLQSGVSLFIKEMKECKKDKKNRSDSIAVPRLT